MHLKKLKTLQKVLFFVVLFLAFNLNLKTLYAQKNIDLQKGLIGFYSFDNKVTDESGNNNHGEVDGANREKDVNGDRNGSYRWNDDSDNIKLPIDINIGALSKVSLCAWVYPQSCYNEIIVISNDDGGGDRKIYTAKSGKKWVWACSDGKGGFIGKTPKKARKWVFLVATYNESTRTASIYVDGVKTSGKTTMDMGAATTLIGANPRGNDDFEALIDEVRIYNRILSKAEIDSLRNLKPLIDNFEEKEKEKTYFYLVKQDNLIVRSEPSTKAQSIGKLNKIDTLRFKEEVPSKGGKWNEWLKIKIDGNTGYVQLKYLNHTSIEEEAISDFEKTIQKYVDWSKWQFWVIMLVLLILGLVGSFKFGYIDQLLNRITKNDYEGKVAYFPLITALSGVFMAILMVIWQDGIGYYLSDNFTLWPSGYGFSAWAVWVILLINAIFFVIMFIESLTCGNIIHGLLRIILQSILAVFTFISVFVITIAVIIIVIIVVVASILLSAIFYRRVYTDMWGNKYVEY
jgi:hypothetical protein